MAIHERVAPTKLLRAPTKSSQLYFTKLSKYVQLTQENEVIFVAIEAFSPDNNLQECGVHLLSLSVVQRKEF